MKVYHRIIFIIILLMCSVYSYSKSPRALNTKKELRLKIEAINSRIESFYLSKDVNSLMKLYDRDVTFFTDYKPGIFEISTLKNFFIDWFKITPLTSYKKKTLSVEVYLDYILELGTFTSGYSSTHNPNAQYKGKYMILWKRNNKGQLNIVSETLCTDSFIEPQAVPFADVHVKDSSFVTNDKSFNQKLLKEVEGFDSVLLKAVAEGDGDARARGFAEDAILLAQFDSVRVGMISIRPKMLNTYKPGLTYLVKHHYSRIIDLGDYIFVNGHYKGAPSDPRMGGEFEGKMSNLFKRTNDGKLLMNRQSTNRDK